MTGIQRMQTDAPHLALLNADISAAGAEKVALCFALPSVETGSVSRAKSSATTGMQRMEMVAIPGAK